MVSRMARMRVAFLVALIPFVLAGCVSSETKGITSSQDVSAKSDLESAEIAVQACIAANVGAYPPSAAGGAGQAVSLHCGSASQTLNVSTGNSLSYSNLGTSYTISVTTSANRTFTYNSASGSVQGP